MKIKFWGVRGSIPAPGPETNRYGGNTSCVSVETAGGLIIIDMGTGLMHLGNALLGGEFGKGKGRAGILLSHTHWDHIQGFPFFAGEPRAYALSQILFTPSRLVVAILLADAGGILLVVASDPRRVSCPSRARRAWRAAASSR